MTRIFASSVAPVIGSSTEPDVVGAFEGKTWGSEGIVGSSAGPRERFGGGAGNGGSGGGGSVGGGGSGRSRASASRGHAKIAVPAASRSASMLAGHFELLNFVAVIVHLLIGGLGSVSTSGKENGTLRNAPP